MISIARIIPTDSTDHVEIHTAQDFRENSSRISRVKTLDGGVYIGYSGTSDGDRAIQLNNEKVTKEQEAALWSMFNDGVSVTVSIPDGFYTAAIKYLKINNGKITATIYLDTRLSA